jgi:hypothetical protein
MTLAAPATTPLNSTLLASATYQAGESQLLLEFCNGAIYLYFGVPEGIHQSLLAADSKGAYFNREIRNHFRYTCLKRPKIRNPS